MAMTWLQQQQQPLPPHLVATASENPKVSKHVK